MSLWNDFLDNIAKPIGGAILGGAKTAGQFVAGGIVSPAQSIVPTITQAGVNIGTSKMLSEYGLTEAAQQGIKENLVFEINKQAVSSDLMLKAAVAAEEKVISPLITRPISTIGLVTDFNSPLYAPGKYEKGFQLNDIARAYKRSEDVSAFVALTQSDLLPGLKSVSNVVFKAGGIETDKIDLWDDQNLKKNFSENIVGRYYTGVGDFIVSNAAIAVATRGAGVGIRYAGKSAGLITRGKSLTQFEKELDEGLQYIYSDGKLGKQSVAASEIKQVADSKDSILISDFVSRYSNNDRLIPLIIDAEDPALVKDFILADKGYVPALDRLSRNAKADLAELGDLPGQIRAKNLLDNDIYQPEGIAIERIREAFEDSIKKNPEHQRVYDAFMSPEGNISSMAKTDVFPIEPVFAKNVFATGRTRLNELKSAAATRDFSKIGWIEERILGTRKEGLLVNLVRFSGTYKPLGFVTFSGARPFDGLVELNSQFDDLIIFKNGSNKIQTAPDVFESATDYRNRWVSAFLGAKTTGERYKVLEDLDATLGLDIARTIGYYDVALVNQLQSTMRQRISKNIDSISRNGYGIDYDGKGLMVDANTSRQLTESFRMSPWATIEKELMRNAKGKNVAKAENGLAALENVYEQITKYWTFDVLARPQYIIKQSYLEPILSAGLSQGTKYIVDEVPNMTKNALKNTYNRVRGYTNKVSGAKQATEVNKVVKDKAQTLDKANQILDMLQAEADAYLTPGRVSPAMVRDNLGLIQRELRAANKLVDNLELDFQDAVKPFGGTEQIPSVVSLQRRIDWIEKNADSNFKARNAAAIANAKAQIGKSRAEMNTLLPDSANLKRIYADMETVYKQIDDVMVKELNEARYQQAIFHQRSEGFKERFYGKGTEYRVIDTPNGPQYSSIESLYDENLFGSAYRAEVENARTTALNYVDELTVGTRQDILLRRGPRTVTDINDPIYFEELAFVLNRTMRGDEMVKLAFSERTVDDIIDWALNTRQGNIYMSQFGDFSRDQVVTIVKNRVGMFKRYVPNAEARALVLEKEINAIELQRILTKDPNVKLSALHPNDFEYDKIDEAVGAKGLGAIEAAADKAMAKTWSWLTSPENPVRWSYADKVFKDTVARKASILAQQGVEITSKTLIDLRAAAAREAVQETEKVFYTVRRKNRALWASRALVAFPTASVNAFYRYGRLAIKNPQRTTAFLHNYQATFKSFGIDQYGNPVEDPTKATHILIPGTKELGLMGGKGIRLNARSIGFLLNLPSLSFFSTIPVGYYVKQKPSREETMKDVMGPAYDYLFPYGVNTDPTKAIVPMWARDYLIYLKGSTSNKDFLESVKSVQNYRYALAEMGLAEMPSQDAIEKEARELYRTKANWSFWSIAGVPAKVETKPMQLFEQYFNILVNKYQTNGDSRDEAVRKAGDEFLATVSPTFPLDRITFSGSSAKTYVPATAEAYKRVWTENNDLIKSLQSIDKTGKLIGLVTLDIDPSKEDSSLAIYKFLKDPKTKLPTGQTLNNVDLTPAEEEQIRSINRVWEKYTNMRDTLEAVAIAKYKKKHLRQVPELQAALKEYGNTVLKTENKDWWLEWQGEGFGSDNAFKYASAFTEIVNDKTFMKKHGDSPLWKDVQGFLTIRNTIAAVYRSLPDRDPRKAILKDNYLNAMSAGMTTFHPKLQDIFKRYFEDDNMKVVG